MRKGHNLSIAERYLSKNKKYYSYETIKKDKQNILEGDINSIIQKLSQNKNAPHMSTIVSNRKSPLAIADYLTIRKSIEKSKLGVNSIHFFQEHQQQMMIKKDLKKQILYYINKIKSPLRSKCSLYQQYLLLSQQTNDYLEYYLTNFSGQDPGQATQLLKQQGKTIILLILKKRYKCLDSNPIDITNRIFLSFQLNPLNDFQFVSWQKFMRIRKLISGDFNRKDYTDFLVNYFFTQQKKVITYSEFWTIFGSIIRKLNKVLDCSHLQILLTKIKENLPDFSSQQQSLTQQKLSKIIQQQPMFIWHQLVMLIFV